MFYMKERCDAGHYCPRGTTYADQHPCPSGTYGEDLERNLTSSTECTTCPARYRCLGGTTTTTIGDCVAGYYCEAGSSAAKPCSAGSYSNRTNLASDGECSTCPAGYYCVGAGSAPSGDCSAGHYCPVGSSSATEADCPAGTFSAEANLYAEDQCEDAPPGSFAYAASTAATSCPAGTFSGNNATVGPGPLDCGDAYPSTCAADATTCVDCPAGYACAEGSTAPAPCGVGTYSNSGADTCTTCPVGYYCGSNTTTSTALFSGGGSWADASDAAGACFPGTFCEDGMARAPDLARDACDPGYYCGSAATSMAPCAAGTYLPFAGGADASDCLETPAGFYTVEGSANYTGLCEPGFYCGAGSTTPFATACPEATYNVLYGKTSVDDCAICVSGGYCEAGSAAPTICPRGYYCVAGLAAPMPCPIGTFGNASALRRS